MLEFTIRICVGQLHCLRICDTPLNGWLILELSFSGMCNNRCVSSVLLTYPNWSYGYLSVYVIYRNHFHAVPLHQIAILVVTNIASKSTNHPYLHMTWNKFEYRQHWVPAMVLYHFKIDLNTTTNTQTIILTKASHFRNIVFGIRLNRYQ